MATTAVPRSREEQDWRSKFIACAEQAMRAWGCPHGGIVKSYRLPFPIHGLHNLDLVGFAEANQQDQETSCYAAHFCQSDTGVGHFHDAARPLATPVMIAGLPGGAVRLAAWTPDRPRIIAQFDSLETFETYWRQPDAGLRAQEVADRKWARGATVSQPSLFGAGILDFAFEATAHEVPCLYESLVRACLARLTRMVKDGNWQPPPRRHKHMPALEEEALWAALLVFGACVLHDKKLLDSPRTDAHAMLREAASGKFGRFFHRSRWGHLPPDELNAIAQGLAGYRFQFLSPYGIGMLYERAFVSEKLREKLAIHYTPVTVANYILGRLPIGDLPPVNRCAADLTSGSGTFLHAALRELQTIQDRETGKAPPLRSFLPRIWGNDKDRFAAALTWLSLIMRTGVNGWQISAGDILDEQCLPVGFKPTIVVGNPPFKLDTAFIGICLRSLPPGGLLGTVLPSDIRDQPSAEECRRQLLNSTDILEIFELPEGLFAKSRKPAVVLIARRRGQQGPANNHVSLRSIGTKQDWWAFLADPAVCTRRDIDQQEWLMRPHAVMTYQSLGALWSKLASTPLTLGAVSEIGNGMQIHGRDADLKGVADSVFTASANRGGWSPYVPKPRGVIGPFALGWETHKEFIDYRGYHERFHKACEPSIMGSRKALLPMSTDERHPWRLRACVDHIGLFVKNTVHYVLPRPGMSSVEELVAVLNSPVANAWYSDRSVQRAILGKNLERLPFPALTPDQRDLLIELVRSLHALNACRLAKGEELMPPRAARNASLFHSVEHWMIRELTLAVDAMVFDAYGLTPQERRLVMGKCPLDARPCFPPPVPAAQLTFATVRRAASPMSQRQCLSTCGRVLAVVEDGGSAIVSVDGLDIGIPVPVKASQLPSSVRAAGRHFRVKIVENALQIQRIMLAALRPYPEADRPREEILAHVRGHLEPREEIELGAEGQGRVP